MKPPTFLTNLPATVCYDYLLCTYIRICYKSIKTLYRQSFYYCIYSQSSNCFFGRKKRKVLVGLYQIYRKGEAQFWLNRARGKLLIIFSKDPLNWATPYCVKSEEGIDEIVIGLPNPSPPSYDFIDRKSLLLLINKFIDYNDRIYSDPIPISSKTIFEIKTTNEEEKYACMVDKYQAFKMPLSLWKSVKVLTIILSSKTAFIMPGLTTSFSKSYQPTSRSTKSFTWQNKGHSQPPEMGNLIAFSLDVQDWCR